MPKSTSLLEGPILQSLAKLAVMGLGAGLAIAGSGLVDANGSWKKTRFTEPEVDEAVLSGKIAGEVMAAEAPRSSRSRRPRSGVCGVA